MKLRYLLLISTVLLVVPLPSIGAHPHIWIESRVEILLEQDRIAAVRVHWTFDAFFTEMIVLDYGRARNGEFTEEQITAIRNGAFANLRHYGYFTYIRVDGRQRPVEQVENFHTYLDGDGALVYEFDIPLDIAVGAGERRIAVAMYDESFFTDMVFHADFVTVRGAAGLSWDADLQRDVYEVPIWGPMNRETVVVEFNPRR